MTQTRRDRKLARWGNETARREHRLDEVPEPELSRITLPAHDVPVSQRPVNADAAALAIALQQLRKRLRRARWIPWQRRKRPRLQAQIDELVRQRRRLKADADGARRL